MKRTGRPSGSISYTTKASKRLLQILDEVGVEKLSGLQEELRNIQHTLDKHRRKDPRGPWALIDAMVDRVWQLLRKVPPETALYMTIGGILGWHGMTPVTAMMNGLYQFAAFMKNPLPGGTGITTGDVITGVLLGPLWGPITLLPKAIEEIDKLKNAAMATAKTKEEKANIVQEYDKKKKEEEIRLRLLGMLLGMLEGVAYTQPGFIPGMFNAGGRVLQGIGEIVSL